MHVPDENLPRYRRLMVLYRKMDFLGATRSNRGDYAGANDIWRRAAKVHHAAQDLRIPGTLGR